MRGKTSSLCPFAVSNDLLSDAQALRERMQSDGYLFFQGLIDSEALLAARREILTRCVEAGFLAEGSEVMAGVAAPEIGFIEGQPEYMAVYNKVMKGERFHGLAFDPGLLAMLQTLFGEEALPHARNIARIIFPQNTLHTTPSHQDYIHIQGTEETYTAWIPLGDCPENLGSLAVLAGSNTGEIFPVHTAYGAGGVGIDTESLPFTWVGGDFALGDVVVFHSLTVHKALPNLDPDHIRLSVDFRYQPLSHPIAASSLLPHFAQVTWEEVYADWTSDHYQYYWRDLPLRYAESDPRVEQVRQAAHKDN